MGLPRWGTSEMKVAGNQMNRISKMKVASNGMELPRCDFQDGSGNGRYWDGKQLDVTTNDFPDGTSKMEVVGNEMGKPFYIMTWDWQDGTSKMEVAGNEIVHLRRSYVMICHVFFFPMKFADDMVLLPFSVFLHCGWMGICVFGYARLLPCHLQVLQIDSYLPDR